VRLRGPDVCPDTQIEILDGEAFEDEEAVLQSSAIHASGDSRSRFCSGRSRCLWGHSVLLYTVAVSSGNGRDDHFLCASRLRRRCRWSRRSRDARRPLHSAFPQPAHQPDRHELGVVQLPLCLRARLLVLEVRKRTVALGNQKERLQPARLFAHMVHQAHQVGLWRKIPDPNSITCSTKCQLDSSWALLSRVFKTYRSAAASSAVPGPCFAETQPLLQRRVSTANLQLACRSLPLP
jgi:hypothetical protein